MMKNQTRYGIALLAIIVIVTGALFYLFQPQFGQDTEEQAIEQIELATVFESTVFRFRYPEDWQHQIPQTNMLFLASPDVLRQQAGATVTIQRSIRLSAEADTLEAALDFYLERGPLRADRDWAIVEAAQSITFDDREALTVVLEGAEVEGTTLMRSEIYITQSNNNLIYVFSVTAPQAQWDSIEATFSAILDSVTILE
ncbi:MAG: hypothetical protein Q9P01_14220 [Anaerolineae bacterium]|nr:hypothetical protein [Anaerolineae bacterium]MDQ7035937.1 hypothetical protein [Anaerolineae bacterium]